MRRNPHDYPSDTASWERDLFCRQQLQRLQGEPRYLGHFCGDVSIHHSLIHSTTLIGHLLHARNI